jgi:hypothetical protein
MNALVCLTLAASFVTAAPESPQWATSYGKALAAAKASGRPLLITFDQQSASKPQILPASYKADSTQKALLGRYVLCHIDTSTDYGKQVAASFRAVPVPYTAIIDRSGRQIIYRKAGAFGAESWATTLVKYKDGQAPQAEAHPAICFT